MKTLIKNRRLYRKRIGSADQSDGEQGPGDEEEGEEGNNDEEGNADEGLFLWSGPLFRFPPICV